MHIPTILFLTSTTLITHTSSIPISSSSASILLSRDASPIALSPVANNSPGALTFPAGLLERRQDDVGACTQNCILYGCDCDCAQDGTVANSAGYGDNFCGSNAGRGGGGGYATKTTPNPSDPGNPGPPGNSPDNGSNGAGGGGDDE